MPHRNTSESWVPQRIKRTKRGGIAA